MQELTFKEKLLIKADIANQMRCCYKNEKILLGYKLLNMYPDNEKKEFFINTLKEYFSETDWGKIVAESSLGQFDNISFWVNKIIEDITEDFNYHIYYKPKNQMIDIFKAAFCVFIEDDVATLSKKAAYALIDKVLETQTLDFLHTVAFYEKNNLNDIKEDNDLNENDRYLNLLDLEFHVNDFSFADIDAEEEMHDFAIKKKEEKPANIFSVQLSFKHLLN